MKHLALGFVLLFLASVSTAQAQTDWRTLLTLSDKKVTAVEGATEIDLSTAKTLHERGVRFIDVRGKSYWKRWHIPGASDIAYPSEATLMEVVDKNEEVVFYCDCFGSPTCNISPNASARAVVWGYQNVYYLTDADGWSAAGYPIEKPE
jgi:rhodanese-related sulfurtransferase